MNVEERWQSVASPQIQKASSKVAWVLVFALTGLLVATASPHLPLNISVSWKSTPLDAESSPNRRAPWNPRMNRRTPTTLEPGRTLERIDPVLTENATNAIAAGAGTKMTRIVEGLVRLRMTTRASPARRPPSRVRVFRVIGRPPGTTMTAALR